MRSYAEAKLLKRMVVEGGVFSAMPQQAVSLNQRLKVELLAENQAFHSNVDMHNIADGSVPGYFTYRLKDYPASMRTTQRTPFLNSRLFTQDLALGSVAELQGATAR